MYLPYLQYLAKMLVFVGRSVTEFFPNVPENVRMYPNVPRMYHECTSECTFFIPHMAHDAPLLRPTIYPLRRLQAPAGGTLARPIGRATRLLGRNPALRTAVPGGYAPPPPTFDFSWVRVFRASSLVVVRRRRRRNQGSLRKGRRHLATRSRQASRDFKWRPWAATTSASALSLGS